MNIRKLLLLLALAAIASIAISHYWKPLPYSEKLIRIQAEQELGVIDERITKEPLEIQALLLDYSANKELTLKAWIALNKYPAKAREIFLLYGSEPEFQEILLAYGDAVIPVIQYFRDNEVNSLIVRKKAETALNKLSDGANSIWNAVTGNEAQTPAPKQPSGELGPTERGWYAVNFIKEEGHSFLGEFVVDKTDKAQWIQTTRLVDALTAFFTSGFRNLETKRALEEEITKGDYFLAAMDMIPLAVAVKLLRAGKVVTASGKELSLASRTSIFASRLIPKGTFFRNFGKYGALIGTAYVLITHPSLISSVFDELATRLGYNPQLVQFVGWFLIITIVLYPFTWALKSMARVILLGFSVLEKASRAIPAKSLI